MAAWSDFSPKKIIRSRHSSFQASHEPLDVRIQIRRSWRQADWFYSDGLQCSSKQFREFPVTIHQQVSLATEKPNLGVCHIPGYLDQPLFIWVHCKAGKMYPPCRKFHEEQQIVIDQAILRPSPNRCEIYRGNHVPVCAEELLPVSLSLSVRRRINPVCLQYLCNRRIRNSVPEIPYRSLDAVITPEGKMLSSTFSDVGRAESAWGTMEAWNRYFRAVRLSLDAKKKETSLAELEDLSRQPHRGTCFDRFLHRPYGHLPRLIRSDHSRS